MIEMLGTYNNGNYNVKIFDDGTKIRENDLDFLSPSFPENIDLKITDYCDAGCAWCHENSTKKGDHGSIHHEFLDTLTPYTELAIGGGNPLSHPGLIEFLEYMKSRKIICNLTVNQVHFEKEQDYIEKLVGNKLIYGLGVSLLNPTTKFLDMVTKYDNTIIHTINGVTSIKQYEKLSDKGLKILILGYKLLRRGNEYYARSSKVEDFKFELKEKLPNLLDKFKTVSFDNLAINQLEIKKLVSEDYWNEFYMGDDGNYTMYIDLVKEEFAASSTRTDRYPLMKNIIDMFNVVRG